MGKFDDIKAKKKGIDKFIDDVDQYQNLADKNNKEPLERLNVEIPKALHKAIKIRAVTDDIKIKELVIKSLNDYLSK